MPGLADGSAPDGHAAGRGRSETPPTDRRLKILLAVLTIALVAVSSSLLTVLALDGSDEVTGTVQAGAAVPSATAAPDTSPTPAESPTSSNPAADAASISPLEPTADAAAGGEQVDPEASFTEAYSGQRLRITDTCGGRRVDLDEPRVGVTSLAYDFTYLYCSDTPLFEFNGQAAVSLGGTEASGPGDCAEAIRVGVDPNSFAPAAGQFICVITSRESARDQGLTQKVALLRVLAVAVDGTLTLEAAAWDVPE